MSTARKISKAEARRLRAQQLAGPPEPAPLPPDIEEQVAAYRPHEVDEDDWQAVRPFVVDVIRRYEPTRVDSTRQRLATLTLYALWARARGYPLDREDLLAFDRIEAFVGQVEASKTTKANYRSRLRGITKKVNPTGTGAGATVSYAHKAVKAPYTDAEIAQIVRIAKTQPSAGIRRQLCACVGLGLGAGLGATDLRHLVAGNAHDLDVDGIKIEVEGDQPRTVWVMAEYEELVRIGLEGLRPNDLVVGTKTNRRNITTGLFVNAEILGDAPHFEQSRFRTTWLARLLTARLPLPVIMDAAGLKGARTLTDLLPYLEVDSDPSQTREVR